MIVTVTPNTCIDQILFVSSFQKSSTMRATDSMISMGGKPTDASWILGELGISSLALGFAAGARGRTVEELLHARGVTTDFIGVGGESRLVMLIIDQSDHTHSTITTSTLEVRPEHIDALRQRYEAALGDATCVVMGGALPAGMPLSFYPDFINMAHAHKVPVIFDASEPTLSTGLAARPAFIKPNRDELSALVGYRIDSLEMAYKAGCEILEKYGTAPIVTLGKDGGLAILPERAYRIPPIKVDVINAAGAGDAVLAGLASALDRKQPIEEGLRLGFAAATAVVITPATADCRREDVERFLPQVELIPYP